MKKIDKDRQATGESGNLEDMFNVGSYSDKGDIPKKGAWGAINFYDEGYEKNSDVSVIVRIEYEVVSDSENENDAKIDTKKIDVVYNGKADENGCIKIDRISILNQIEKDGDVVNRPSHINIKVDISTAQGRPKEVLGEDNVSQKNDIPQDDITSYAAEHASSEKKSTYGIRDGLEGGVVKNDAQGKNEKPVFSGKIRVDMYAEKVTPINK